MKTQDTLSIIQVRLAAPADYPQAIELLARFFQEEGFAPTRATIAERLPVMLSQTGSACFLAWKGDSAVGIATVTSNYGLEFGWSAELEDLYILPHIRGAAVGARLIDAVAGWCAERGYTLVSVVVTEEGQEQHDLIGYYRKRGFVNSGRLLLYRRLMEDSAM